MKDNKRQLIKQNIEGYLKSRISEFALMDISQELKKWAKEYTGDSRITLSYDYVVSKRMYSITVYCNNKQTYKILEQLRRYMQNKKFIVKEIK